MVQNGEWGGNPELYAAAWLYGTNITIYSQEYTNTNGMLVINADGHQGVLDMARPMWTISYHGNNHYNSIRSLGNPYPNGTYKECPTIPVLPTADLG